MARIINLRQARKQRMRDRKRADGDGNAARHGEAKDIREAREAEDARAARALDGHARDNDRPEPSRDD